jgi:hypothetical protein
MNENRRELASLITCKQHLKIKALLELYAPLIENWKKTIPPNFDSTILLIIEKSVQIKAELLMDLVHLGLESAVFVSKTVLKIQ